MRLNRRLPQQLGVSEVQPPTLSENLFYQLLMKRYQDSYFSISKNNQIKTDVMDEIKTVSDAFYVFVARLMTSKRPDTNNGFFGRIKRR